MQQNNDKNHPVTRISLTLSFIYKYANIKKTPDFKSTGKCVYTKNETNKEKKERHTNQGEEIVFPTPSQPIQNSGGECRTTHKGQNSLPAQRGAMPRCSTYRVSCPPTCSARASAAAGEGSGGPGKRGQLQRLLQGLRSQPRPGMRPPPPPADWREAGAAADLWSPWELWTWATFSQKHCQHHGGPEIITEL